MPDPHPRKRTASLLHRQVAMYLAKHVAGWSTTMIGRFYQGRDYSTVLHGIQRIETLRESDPEVDALVSELKRQLKQPEDDLRENGHAGDPARAANSSYFGIDELADAIVERICARLSQQYRERAWTTSQ